MRRFVCLFLAACLALSVVACGGSSGDGNGEQQPADEVNGDADENRGKDEDGVMEIR